MIFRIVGKTYKLDEGVLDRVAKAAFSYLPETEGEIELQFVSKRQIQELNRKYRNIDKPTDVLSFQLSCSPLVGQIFICYTYSVAQAKRLNKTLLDELALLTVHGILHIFDYDHADTLTETQMQKIEKEILMKEGIAR